MIKLIGDDPIPEDLVAVNERQVVQKLLTGFDKFASRPEAFLLGSVGCLAALPCDQQAQDLVKRAFKCGITEIPESVLQAAGMIEDGDYTILDAERDCA